MTDEDEILTGENNGSFGGEAAGDNSGPSGKEAAGEFLLDLETLLEPIPGENPAGESLRYEGTYDLIKQAREAEADLPQGVWERELKKADWKKVKRVCLEVLEGRTKDLQISVWLLESLLHLHGFSGVKEGMRLLMGLCERFWDHLYPEIEEEDLESRVSPFYWMNEKLYYELKMIQITQPDSVDASPYTWADWEAAERLENLALKDKDLLQDAESKGKVTRAKFLGSVMFTPRHFYDSQLGYLQTSIQVTTELERFLDEKCGRQAPSLKQFRDTLEDIRRLVHDFLKEKREEDEQEMAGDEEQQPFFAEEEAEEEEGRKYGVGKIRSRRDAYRMLSAAADYLLIHEPHSPTPYLVKRAVSWGNMTLSELLYELVGDEHDLVQIYKLLGIKGPPMME